MLIRCGAGGSMSEEEYLIALAKTLKELIRGTGGPLEEQTELYLKTVIDIFPKFCNDKSWRIDQINLMEDFIYKYCIKELSEWGFVGEVCKTNDSFLKFLREKTPS